MATRPINGAQCRRTAIWRCGGTTSRRFHQSRNAGLRPELHEECRICYAGRHAILYRIKEDHIEIGRVLHEAMDYPRHVERLLSDSGDD